MPKREEVRRDMAKQKVLMPSYVYAFHPYYGYYPYMAWEEVQLEY